MRYRTVTAEVQIPGVILGVDPGSLHPRRQDIEPLLALAAADDLPDTGDQDIHGRHGPAIIIDPHIEGLDRGRIIGDDKRPPEDLFGQIAFMLRLQIDSPADLELKFFLRLQQAIDGLGVGDMGEFLLHHPPAVWREAPFL